VTRRRLFVFAHQDDEIAAAPFILEGVRAGAEVFCAYLTDGAALGASPAVRDEESRRALQRLGVSRERIHFIGSSLRIPDGALVDYLDRAHGAIETALGAVPFDEIFCLAYEGGHPDHDASHIVAMAFAASRGLMDRCWAVPLYRGTGRRPFYRVLAPLGPHAAIKARVTTADAMRVISLFSAYPSQRPSIYGFLPEAAVRLLVLRRAAFHRVDRRRVSERPHEGPLFYEWRYRFPYERFAAASRPFIERYLAG
jgi:N-acetylglucosamine malate deacetylase 1